MPPVLFSVLRTQLPGALSTPVPGTLDTGVKRGDPTLLTMVGSSWHPHTVQSGDALSFKDTVS